jgi:hypothetical protein
MCVAHVAQQMARRNASDHLFIQQRYGFGRIHVKRVDKGSRIHWPSIWRSRDGKMFRGKRLWAAFGAFKHCKVRRVVVESNFTEAVKFCQQELKQSKLPFLFVQVLHQAERVIRSNSRWPAPS